MRTFSPKQIAERICETYPFEGDWKKILGEPDIRFSTLIRGEAKSGKSTYAAKFAQMCSEFGRVLYITAEERINSKTLKQRLEYCGVTSEKVRFVHEKDFDNIEGMIRRGKYRFVIFDSVQHINMSFEQFETMRHNFKRRKLSYHLIMQMGISIAKWKHEVDVLIEVKQGFAQVHGRYNAANRIQVLHGNNQQQRLF